MSGGEHAGRLRTPVLQKVRELFGFNFNFKSFFRFGGDFRLFFRFSFDVQILNGAYSYFHLNS